MTDDEHEMICQIKRDVAKTNKFLFEAPIKGKPPREDQLDELLAAVRAGKLGGRIILWAAGAIIAITTAYAQIRGLGK